MRRYSRALFRIITAKLQISNAAHTQRLQSAIRQSFLFLTGKSEGKEKRLCSTLTDGKCFVRLDDQSSIKRRNLPLDPLRHRKISSHGSTCRRGLLTQCFTPGQSLFKKMNAMTGQLNLKVLRITGEDSVMLSIASASIGRSRSMITTQMKIGTLHDKGIFFFDATTRRSLFHCEIMLLSRREQIAQQLFPDGHGSSSFIRR